MSSVKPVLSKKKSVSGKLLVAPPEKIKSKKKKKEPIQSGIALSGFVYCNGCGNLQFEITHTGVEIYNLISKQMHNLGGSVTKAGKVICPVCKPTEHRNPAWAKR